MLELSWMKTANSDQTVCLHSLFHIYTQAKVTKWKGRYPGGTYNSVYHSASSWYSPSNCYIQSKLLNNKLKVRFYISVC